jgi:hypothetical protein
MSSKKAVTDIILAIGILVAILMVFLIGLRVFSLVVKETPQFLSEEMAFTANTALAAPENVQILNTLPQARREGFMKLTSKSWVALIDPDYVRHAACVTKLSENDFATFLSVLGGPFTLGLTISYSGNKITVGGYTWTFDCSVFTDDKFSDRGGPALFTENSLTVKTYNATTNTNRLEVTNG